MALPGIDAALNTAEYFVHHEDIRRAADGWEPRALEPDEQDALWRVVRVSGKGLIRPAGVPVLVRRPTPARRPTCKAGSDPVRDQRPAVGARAVPLRPQRDLRPHLRGT